MIGVRMRGWLPGRSGRVGLVLGLVLLITAHLAGNVHASAFAGPHLAVEVADGSPPEAHDDHGHEPGPGHDHKADRHIDHAADRPRDAGDGTVVGPGHHVPDPAPQAVTGAEVAHPAWAGPPDGPPLPDGRGTLTLHCVWRQ